MKRFALSRRACLKGLGVSLGLPFLEAMEPRRASAAAAPPLRYLCVYSPNGYLMPRWTPVDTGPNWTTSPLLKPLEPFKADMNVISGLGNWTASITTMFGGSHTRACGSLLTQTPILFSTNTANVRNGVSVDQIIANTVGPMTKFPSLPVGSRAGSTTGNCEDGFSCAYNNNISWSGPTTPLTKQVNPRDIFTRLFGMGTTGMPTPGPMTTDNGPLYQKSILDVVMARTDALKQRLGKTDKSKLDEYFTSVREAEMRIDRLITMPTAPPAAQCMPGAGPPNTPTANLVFKDQLDLISDLIVLAFQCDSTRVVTYMYEHSFNDLRSFNFLPGVTQGHHQITHSNAPDQEATINLFYYERFAYLLGKLKAAQDPGGGSILDNSIVMMTSEFGDAHLHDHRSLAVVLAGKAGGKFKTGQHIKYTPAPGAGTGVDGRGNRDDTQIAQLHLTVLHAFGINDPSFGHDDTGPIATKTLPEIQA